MLDFEGMELTGQSVGIVIDFVCQQLVRNLTVCHYPIFVSQYGSVFGNGHPEMTLRG